MVRLLLAVFALMAFAQMGQAQRAGVGAWENPNYTILGWIEDVPGLGWYYDWRTDQIEHKGQLRRSVEFVPMIHSARNVDDPIVSSGPVRALLGFNEPDGTGGSHQAGMSVDEAIALWPKLEARGLRLGSPAVTRENTLGAGSWQRRFMTEAERRGLRVDFMAVHYYTTDGDTEAFRDWLVAVHREYQRPIWVTEFAYIDWNRPGRATHRNNARFIKSAIPMLEQLPFVERYAWFSANPYPWHGRTPRINLVTDGLKSTPAGAAFSRAVSEAASFRSADLSR